MNFLPSRLFWMIRSRLKLAAACSLLLAAAASHAQQFAIDWYTVDGGGGVSGGGDYVLTGTIGQPDASDPMAGGTFAVIGGFWALPIGVSTPDSPTLHIAPAAPGSARISWTSGGPGFVLQVSEDLQSWSDAPSGAANPAFVPTTFPKGLYRLRRP
jgi:hypothetical protein